MAHIFEAAPLYISKFYSGLITRRSALTTPIRIMGRRIIELFDALWNGSLNMELGPLAKLQRRPGFLTFNSNTLLGIPQNYYSFKNSTNGTIYPIVDTTTNVYYVQSGSAAPTSLVTKTQTTQTTFKGIGSYLYMGNAQFSQKWDGGSPQGVTNWGIAGATIAAGPNLAGAGANVNPGSGIAWTNPSNVTSAVSFATVNLTTGLNSYSQLLEATQFALSPTGTQVTGIAVTADFQTTGLPTPQQGAINFTMLKAGNPAGIAKAYFFFDTNLHTITFGGPGDLWGTTWTINDITQTTFGVMAVCSSGNVTRTMSARNFNITIYTNGGPAISVSGSAGSLSAITGYQYVYCYGNSSTGHVSSPTPTSASTGAFSSKLNVSVTVVASTDTQVNQIRVFRTTDGGPANQFFELPNSPFANTSTNILDTSTDTNLQLVQAPQPLVNNPPPGGLTNMEWYAGRLWGSVGNLLYFSTGPDTTLGNPQECWAPGYVFVLPTTIVKNVAIPSGMLVWTLDAVHIVQGTSTASFTVNYFLQDIGARTYNAIDTDGSMIYAFTSDRHLLTINAGGTGEPGYNVGDILDTLDPTLVYLSCHRSGSLDQKLFISDGSTNLYSYDLSFQAWNPKAVPTGGLNAIGSIEITPGVYKFLLGATTAGQVVLQRDLATFQDNGTSYTCTGVLGSFQLADPGMLAALEAVAIEYANVGSDPTVGILAGEISGTFTTVTNPVNEPPEFATPNQSFNAKRWNIRQAAIDQNMRHFQLSISFPAENFKNEVTGIGMWGPLATSNVQPTKMPQIQGR